MEREESLGKEAVGDALKAAFDGAQASDPAASVVVRLEQAGRRAPHVHLRDLPDESRVLKPRKGTSGRYQLVGEIARGGVGVVLKARDGDLGRDVAMKVIRPEHLDNPELIQRFVEEAQVGGQLQHPGIVPVYEMGLNESKRPYFTMRLVKGKTLAALLGEREDLTQHRRRFLAIFERVCNAIAYAHSRGVIHRDLKPANIILGTHSEVQVVDWGFAKVLGSEDTVAARPIDATVVETVRTGSEGSGSMAGSVMGTPAYMAPEQALGQVGDLDERTDVFGLGAILCEIVTGSAPYTGASNAEILTAAIRCDLDDAHARLDASEADEGLLEIARACLQPAASSRPADAGVLARRIQAYTASVEERAREAQVEAAEEEVRVVEAVKARQLSRFLSVAIVLLALVGVGGAIWIESSRRSREADAQLAIEPALAEANRLRGRGELDAAVEVAKRAHDLAVSRGADPETITRTADLVARTRRERAAAAAEAEWARKDEILLRTLVETDLDYGDLLTAAETDQAMGEALRAYGFDVDRDEHAGIANHFRARPKEFALEVAGVLLGWTGMRLLANRSEKEAARPAQLADLLDPDPWRTRLRKSVVTADVSLRETLINEAEAEDLHPRSVRSLARFTDVPEFASRMKAILQRAQRKHPDNVWLNHHLGIAFKMGTAADRRIAPEFFRAAVMRHPDSVGRHHHLGMALEATGDLEGALEAYQRASDLAPQNGHMLSHVASATVSLGNPARGLELARRAVEISPTDATARQFLALLVARTDPEAGVAEYRRALEISRSPRYRATTILQNMAHCLFGMGRADKALAAHRQAVEEYPRAQESLRILGLAAWQRRDFDESIDFLGRALDIDPTRGDVAANLAYSHTGKKDYAAAIAVLRKTRKTMRSRGATAGLSAVMYALGATLSNHTQEYEEALACLREALRLHLESSAAPAASIDVTSVLTTGGALTPQQLRDESIKRCHQSIVTTLFRAGDRDGAMAHLRAVARTYDAAWAHEYIANNLPVGEIRRNLEHRRAAVRLEPDNAVLWRNLAQTWLVADSPADALAPAQRGLDLEPDSAVAKARMAHVMHLLGHREEALRLARAALADDISGEASFVVGKRALDTGALESAILHLERALEKQPHAIWQWHTGLAAAYWYDGRAKAAQETIRKALRYWPSNTLLLGEYAYYLAAASRAEDRNTVEGLRIAKAIVDHMPNNSWYVAQLGDIQYHAGDHRSAVAHIERAVGRGEVHTQFVPHWLRLTLALGKLGRTEDAARAFARVENQLESVPPMLSYFGRKDFEKLVAEVKAALKEEGEK